MSVTHFLQNRKQQKNASRAGSLSRSATAPSRREPLLVRIFFLCAAEKAKAKFEFLKLKIRTLFFCGSAARQPLPFWEEGVTRGA